MSLKTWKAEFYPVPAHKVSKRKALEHSLRKWIGLLPGAMKRHGLTHDTVFVCLPAISDGSSGSLFIDSGSCALCAHFLNLDTQCQDCPLGKPACDSAFRVYGHTANPRRMIAALRAALKKHESRTVGKGKVLGNK